MTKKVSAQSQRIDELDFETQLHPGAVKVAMKEISASSSDLWKVSPSDLHVLPDFNVRVKNDQFHAHIRSLADSMLTEGFYQSRPLSGYVAKKDGEQIVYITDGHCRLEAALLAISEGAEIEKLPVVVSQAGISMEDLTVALVRANGGRELDPFEVGVVCKRLVRYGLDEADIARRIGFTEQYVHNLLSLMAAPAELRKMVLDGVVSASTAIETIAARGEKALDYLRQAQEKANADGKTRVTKKHIAPKNQFKQAVKKSAAKIYGAITEVRSDPGYASLSEDIRKKLDAILNEIGREPVSEG